MNRSVPDRPVVGARFVPDWLAVSARSAPDRLAVSAVSSRWTNKELDVASDVLAAALAGLGIVAGSRVAALLADDAPAVALISAARRSRAVLVPLNRRAARAELQYQLGAAEAAVIVHDDAHAAPASAMAAGTACRPLSVEAALAGAPPDPGGDSPAASVDLDELATIVFTSGTTGRPKGALLSHGNHVTSADAWAAVLAPRPEDRWLVCLPFFHVAGLAIVVRAGRWGVPLEVAGRYEAGDVVARIEAGISHLSLVPWQLRQLLELLAGRPVPLTLRAILLGGGPIPAGLLRQARASGLPVLSTYGMTETASGLALGGAEAATLADPTALRALPGVEIRIGATGDGVGATGDGEIIGPILVRGPMVFGGYLGDAGATAERLGDGWLHTGDMGHLDEHGLLHVADRREDLIISGGENIYPAEVEAVLLAHPAVAEAAVLGQPHAAWGSVPVAAIVTAADRDVSDAALERYCRERLAGYKVPARWHRVASLPRNESGKILRRELREALLAEPG